MESKAKKENVFAEKEDCPESPVRPVSFKAKMGFTTSRDLVVQKEIWVDLVSVAIRFD